MAQNATIHKVELSVADMDRHHYDTYRLTVARHPSETEARMMLRILAFALNAHERLEMTRGLSSDDAPDLWQKSLGGELELSVALGLPSEKLLRQSCNASDRVVVYTYGGRAAQVWWDKSKSGLARFGNLGVVNLSETDHAALAGLSDRAMRLQVSIQEGEVMVISDSATVCLSPESWKTAA